VFHVPEVLPAAGTSLESGTSLEWRLLHTQQVSFHGFFQLMERRWNDAGIWLTRLVNNFLN
jgi:hypothetical protein